MEGWPKTCGKCGGEIAEPGPCPTCNDKPFGELARQASRHRFYVYIVRSKKTDALYTGVALDPEKRVKEHNSGRGKGSKCLRGQLPVSLVWTLPFPVPRGEALKIEKRIKKLPREAKMRVVAGALDPR